MKLGFIGTGVITDAIVQGLLKTDYPIDAFFLSARSRTTSARLAALSDKVRVCERNDEIVTAADVLFLAVRPQHARDVLAPLTFQAGQIIVSLIATIPIDDLRASTHPEAEICRAIPLPAVADLTGVTAVYPPSPVAEALFASLGQVVPATTLEEFDAYAVASAMMGLYFGLSEVAARWLADQGAPCDGARAYVARMFQSLAETATRLPEKDFETLRLEHTTPGGLNAQLYDTFVDEGGTEALASAFEAVAKRIRDAGSGG